MLNCYQLKYSTEIKSDFQTMLSILIYEIQPEKINSLNINSSLNMYTNRYTHYFDIDQLIFCFIN